MSEKYGKLGRRKAQLEARAAVMADVVRGLSGEQAAFVEHVELEPRAIAFGSEALLLLKAQTRRDVLPLLQLFPPYGLDSVEFKVGGHGIVPTPTQFSAAQVSKREPIVPLLYHVTQTRKVARHTATWVAVLDGHIQATIECDIAEDRAGFTFEHMDDVGHNQVLFRRRANAYVPDGLRFETRGLDWSPTKDVTASATIYWPYTHLKFSGLGYEWKILPICAALALEVSQEAHADET